jgi:hypothetical protein
MMYMQFSSWKEWIKKYTKNDKDYNNNNNEKPEGEQQDPSSAAPPSSTELLQPSQEITRESVICNNDGTVRLFPTNKNGSHFVLGKQNPNNLKNFTTDSHNEFVKKKERNIEYWSVFSGDITYRSTGEHAKSCRLNIYVSTTKQTNDWKAAMKSGFIGNEKDLKNQEVTAIIRVNKRVGHKTACCIKMRGGGHHRDKPDQAACIQLDVSTRDSGHAARWAKELSHPLYEYQNLKPFFGFFVEEGKWFGMKTTSWNNNNNKDNTTTTATTNRCYIDPDPFNSADGTLRNNYRLYSEYIDKGNGNRYPEIVVNWAGGVPITIRVDGFENVDFYACNAIEIIPPSSC